MKIKYNQKENSIDISFRLNETLLALVKLLPDRDFCNEDGYKFWRVPIQPNVYLEKVLGEFLEDVQATGETIQIDEKIFTAIEVVEHWEAVNLALSTSDSPMDDISWQTALKAPMSYQEQAYAQYISRNARGVICGGDPNARRVASLAVVRKNNMFPVLILCAQDLKFNWASRAKLLTGQSSTIFGEERAIIAQVRDEPIQPVAVCNYGRLLQEFVTLSQVRWDCIILDDSHHIRSSHSKQAEKIFHLASVAKHKILLSSSPLNDPSAWTAQLEIIDQMKKTFGTRTQFLTRYNNLRQGSNGWNLGAPAHVDEFEERLRSSCYCGNPETQEVKGNE